VYACARACPVCLRTCRLCRRLAVTAGAAGGRADPRPTAILIGWRAVGDGGLGRGVGEYCQHTLIYPWRNTASTPYPFHGGILPAHPTPFTFTIPTHRPTFVVAQLIPGPRHQHSDGALDYFPRLRWEPSTAGPSVISIFVFPPPKTEDVSFARVTASWNASSFFFSILFFGVGIPERRVRLRPRGCWRGRGRVGRWPVALGSFSERALS